MGNRIEYIDALRGFTMILVVFNHIEAFCLWGNQTTFLSLLFQQFRMPLFFFVSGYLAYKEFKPLRSDVIAKARMLLLPTLLWGLVYTYCYLSQDVYSFMKNLNKFGYWFTIVLFEIYGIYYTILYLLNVISKGGKSEYKWLVSFIGTAIVLNLFRFPFKSDVMLNNIGNILCLHHLFNYFQFFVLGLIARKYRIKFERLLDNGSIMALVILLFIGSFYLNNYVVGELDSCIIAHRFIKTICGYCGILLVYAFFRKYCTSIGEYNIIEKLLKYIGRRTLMIYLLHYFFLTPLPSIKAFLIDNNSVILELFCGINLSLLVICCCLITYNLFKISSFINYWLLGAKKV